MCTISDTKDTKQANPPPADLCSLNYLGTKFTFICRLCCNSFVIFTLVCQKVTWTFESVKASPGEQLGQFGGWF